MTIKYYRKNIYGKELIYINEQKETIQEGITRLAIQSLTGTRWTLTEKHIEALKTLGIKCEEILPPKQE